MPREIYLIKVGMTMTEGMVSEWYIPDGGAVKKGEMVYALETEKVNLDVDAEYDGTVRHLVEAGLTLAPGDVVGYIFEAGEEIPADLGGAPATPAADMPVVTEAKETAVAAKSVPASSAGAGGHIKSSPAARRAMK